MRKEHETKRIKEEEGLGKVFHYSHVMREEHETKRIKEEEGLGKVFHYSHVVWIPAGITNSLPYNTLAQLTSIFKE